MHFISTQERLTNGLIHGKCNITLTPINKQMSFVSLIFSQKSNSYIFTYPPVSFVVKIKGNLLIKTCRN